MESVSQRLVAKRDNRGGSALEAEGMPSIFGVDLRTFDNDQGDVSLTLGALRLRQCVAADVAGPVNLDHPIDH